MDIYLYSPIIKEDEDNFDIFCENMVIRRLAQTLALDKLGGKISIECIGIQGIDKDSKQTFIYIPALEISGYGETFEKARQMLDFSAIELCKYLLQLGDKELHNELDKLGWQYDSAKDKSFSRAFVDGEGNLREFNSENLEIVQVEFP